MKLTFKRREVKDLQHLSTLVAENVEAIEPSLKILASNLNLGRTSIEIAALDGNNTPVLITLGMTADDTMLVRALEAYAWCLEYPESLERLVPAAVQLALPPRMVFVSERLLEAFVRKMRLLRFNAVECFEYRYVESGGTTGFYLDRVDWDQSGSAVPEPPLEKPERRRPATVAPPAPPRPAPNVAAPVVAPAVVTPPAPPPPEPVVVHDEPPVTVPEERVVMVYEEPPAAPRPEPPIRPREVPKVIAPEPPKSAPRAEPPKPAPLEPPRSMPREAPKPDVVEPARANGGGAPGERPPVMLKGLQPPARKPRDVPHIPRPLFEEATPPPRPSPAAPAPTTPAAARASRGEPKLEPTVDPRAVQRGLDAYTKSAPGKNGGTRSDPAKGDLAPTWRKFLDRLTSTFEPRAPAPPTETPPTAAAKNADEPLTVQPFAADIESGIQEGVHDAVTELSDKQLNILPGLTLPDNGELAPQWRKFLDHPTLDEAKIAVVRAYLQREFPLCTVYDFYDFQRNAQVFQLQDNHGKVTQLITMTAEFFDSHRDLEIRAWIEKHRLAHAMRQAGQAGVLVSQAGLQIEKR
jgi:hypothetical protein